MRSVFCPPPLFFQTDDRPNAVRTTVRVPCGQVSEWASDDCPPSCGKVLGNHKANSWTFVGIMGIICERRESQRLLYWTWMSI